jgi:hypothetical protein
MVCSLFFVRLSLAVGVLTLHTQLAVRTTWTAALVTSCGIVFVVKFVWRNVC